MYASIVKNLIASGLTQTEIAVRCNVTQATISRIQHGHERLLASTADALRGLYAERCAQKKVAT